MLPPELHRGTLRDYVSSGHYIDPLRKAAGCAGLNLAVCWLQQIMATPRSADYTRARQKAIAYHRLPGRGTPTSFILRSAFRSDSGATNLSRTVVFPALMTVASR